MRQLLNKQKRAESDNSNLQKKLKDLKNDLNNTNSTLAEKDGVNLNMEKEINRLKANLKLSTNENDQCQKRLDQALADYNNLRSSNLMENQQMQKYKRDLTDLERNDYEIIRLKEMTSY
jgi:septal ring factor EnvC (AmiA/AmiB activator)